MTPPPWIFLSFLYTLYGKFPGRVLKLHFGFLDSYNMWLVKVKESQQFQVFAPYATDIHANEFQPTNKAAFICTIW